MIKTMPLSPVERALKELPRGYGNWPGFDHVYDRLSTAAANMGKSGARLGESHVKTMAILGCGHEKTMKAHMAWCRMYGWCN